MSHSTVNFISRLFIIYLTTSVINLISCNEHCIQDKNCRCIYENGRGVDLNQQFKSDEYIVSASLDNLTYYFHACKDVKTLPYNLTNTTNECYSENEGYSLCVFNKTSQSNIKLGLNKDAQFTASSVHEINYLRYFHKDHVTAILLICVPEIANTHLLVNPVINNTHNLILYTPSACIRELTLPGLGGFAVFLIISISLALAYLVVGVLVNRLALGARGVEQIPNLAFWSSLPGKFMSALEFCKNGCKRRSSDTQQLDPNSYDAI